MESTPKVRSAPSTQPASAEPTAKSLQGSRVPLPGFQRLENAATTLKEKHVTVIRNLKEFFINAYDKAKTAYEVYKTAREVKRQVDNIAQGIPSASEFVSENVTLGDVVEVAGTVIEGYKQGKEAYNEAAAGVNDAREAFNELIEAVLPDETPPPSVDLGSAKKLYSQARGAVKAECERSRALPSQNESQWGFNDLFGGVVDLVKDPFNR